MAELTMVQALNKAISDEMERDPSVFCLGEDISDKDGGYGGAFAVTRGLYEKFGEDRVLNTPISEILISGVAVGAAMAGSRPIADLQYGDFIFCMMDQLCNQAAKMCYMSGGQVKVPMVLRAPVGATQRGAQHAQSLEGFFTRVPGLKVICPATPYDAVGLLKTAIRDDNPVIVFEHKKLYGGKRVEAGAISPVGEVPDEEYTIDFGKAEIKRNGADVTIVSNLLMMYRALEAANQLEKEGISCEIIDPRTLVPFDFDTVIKSVKKTGRLMIVHEDTYSNGWGAEISAYVAEHAIYYLDAPIVRVTTYDTPIPFSPVLEDHVIPSTQRIIESVRQLMDS